MRQQQRNKDGLPRFLKVRHGWFAFLFPVIACGPNDAVPKPNESPALPASPTALAPRVPQVCQALTPSPGAIPIGAVVPAREDEEIYLYSGRYLGEHGEMGGDTHAFQQFAILTLAPNGAADEVAIEASRAGPPRYAVGILCWWLPPGTPPGDKATQIGIYPSIRERGFHLSSGELIGIGDDLHARVFRQVPTTSQLATGRCTQAWEGSFDDLRTRSDVFVRASRDEFTVVSIWSGGRARFVNYDGRGPNPVYRVVDGCWWADSGVRVLFVQDDEQLEFVRRGDVLLASSKSEQSDLRLAVGPDRSEPLIPPSNAEMARP